MLLKLNRKKAPREEVRYYLELSAELTSEQEERLNWLLAETFAPDELGPDSFMQGFSDVIEVGPNLRFTTPWSTTAMDIFRQCGLEQIARVEYTRRTGLDTILPLEEREACVAALVDRMTEMPYPLNFAGFPIPAIPEPVRIIPLLEQGTEPLIEINRSLGLAMGEQDLEFCIWLFTELLQRNPTDVELF